jgi:hypothetical protein
MASKSWQACAIYLGWYSDAKLNPFVPRRKQLIPAERAENQE